MTKNIKRQYSSRTIRLLFGASGNQCAHPDCTNPVIEPATPYSDAAVVAQICHIYAASDNGPRGKPGLTSARRNAPENLLLMCGHHHPIVDKQWETYPAQLLHEWKRVHEAKYQQGTAEAAKLTETMQRSAFLQDLSDKQIIDALDRIARARWLFGFALEDAAMVLARRVDTGELAGGSSAVRARALAQCARLLHRGKNSAEAREFLKKAMRLAPCEEISLAEAFFDSLTDVERALTALASISSPAARTAALTIMFNQGQADGAVSWVDRAGLTLEDFDASGKFMFLTYLLATHEWTRAAQVASQITCRDFEAIPALHHPVAMAELLQTVPAELRAATLRHMPFLKAHFVLASDDEALVLRRRAMASFSRVAEFATSMGLGAASDQASDFALWLKLLDPEHHEEGLAELRASMRDPSQSLRRVHIALQFGLDLDIAAVEKEIDRRVALSGSGTMDEALARLALAHTRDNLETFAEYLAKHRTQFNRHFPKSVISSIEIEALARAGRPEQAREVLDRAIAEGLSERDQQIFRRIIAEAEGADPAAARKAAFKSTGSLVDLANLANFLEDQAAWSELLPYAEELFARTRALGDAIRIVRALNESQEYSRLFDFLDRHGELVAQAVILKTLWAWSLFRAGRFGEARIVLAELLAMRDEPIDRALRVKIAVSSGHWEDLTGYVESEWERRASRTAVELLAAADLAQAIGSQREQDFVRLATEKAPSDPGVLAGAYFCASRGGWDQTRTVGAWLVRAVELSGSDGPLKQMPVKEFFDQLPERVRAENSMWTELKRGAIPAFGWAQIMNRPLTEMIVGRSLANRRKADLRNRSVIFAFSGARDLDALPELHSIALDLSALFTFAHLDILDAVLNTYSNIIIPHSTITWLFQERQQTKFHQPSRIEDAHVIKRLIAESAIHVVKSERSVDPTLSAEIGDDLAMLLTAAGEAADGTARLVVRSAPIHRVTSMLVEEADLSSYAYRLCSCQTVVKKLRAKGLLTLSEEERALAYLKLHERLWPEEPTIADNAELYLDGVSLTYFMTIGVLDKLRDGGFQVFISESEDTKANNFLSLEGLIDRQLETIDVIRKALARGLDDGHIQAVRSVEVSHTEPGMAAHPSEALLRIGESVDAIVIDDRFVNRHRQLRGQDRDILTLSSLDLLNDLANRGHLSRDDLFACRTILRQAGYQLVPVTEEELLHHLKYTELADGAVVETAELRAIRESLLRARMENMLQMPLEFPWLRHSTGAIVRTIQSLWLVKPNYAEAAAYCDWLLPMLDVRGWAGTANPGSERSFPLLAYAAQLLLLTSPHQKASESTQRAYFKWLREHLLDEIEASEPEIFQWLVARAREMIANMVERLASQEGEQ